MRTEHVLITGASSGMGRGLARRLAKPGITLHLGGRNEARLAETASFCAGRGADVRPRRLDVRDASGMADWVGGCGRLDLVLACAGVTGGVSSEDRDGASWEATEQVREMIETNLLGVVNTVLPALTLMRQQPRGSDGVRGRICAIASVAGVVSYPGTPSYCASKAGVDRLMVSLGGAARRSGVLTTSVVCGFVDTPMTAPNRFAMPGIVSCEDAVARILRGVSAGRRRVVFPSWLVAGSRLMDLLPIRWAEAYYTRQPTGCAGSMQPLQAEPAHRA